MSVLESNWFEVAGDAQRLRPHPTCESTQLKPEDNLSSWHSCSSKHYMVRNLGAGVPPQVLAHLLRAFIAKKSPLCIPRRNKLQAYNITGQGHTLRYRERNVPR